jgi:hypothetical protein
MLKHAVVTARAKSAEKSDSPVPMPSKGPPKQSSESVTQRRQSSTKRNAADMECVLCPTALCPTGPDEGFAVLTEEARSSGHGLQTQFITMEMPEL